MEQATADKIVEIDRNFEWFLTVLPNLVADHAGEWALIRHRHIVGFHPSALHAQIAGNQQFSDSAFSVQEVYREPEELGFYSYALYPG